VSVKPDTSKEKPKGQPAEYMRTIAKLGGQARQAKKITDNGQAFEKSSEQVAMVALDLGEQVQSLLRAHKRGESVGQKLQQFSTSFGIWFDKLHKISAGQTGMDVDLNPKLAQSITSKVSGLQALTAKVALLSEECDRYKMLIQAADEGMIGP
jgi:hypothetical protein